MLRYVSTRMTECLGKLLSVFEFNTGNRNDYFKNKV